jgi:HAE1 family hydrophobic/amphiphilic exporter-1
VGQTSEGFAGAQSTAYKGEITVTLVDAEQRTDNSFVYAAKTKLELQKVLVGAKIKTVPVSIMGGADEAPIALTVTGNDLKVPTSGQRLPLMSCAKYREHRK